MRASTVAILVAVLATSCQGKSGAAAGAGSAGATLGTEAPALAGPTLDGEAFTLADHRGEVVLVNVWATWCAPCRAELPELRKLHHELRDRGFSVVGVSVDARRALGPLRAMVRELEIDYPIVFDPEQRAIEPFAVRGYPTSILVDRQGKIRWRRDGMIHPDDPELAAAITGALAGP